MTIEIMENEVPYTLLTVCREDIIGMGRMGGNLI